MQKEQPPQSLPTLQVYRTSKARGLAVAATALFGTVICMCFCIPAVFFLLLPPYEGAKTMALLLVLLIFAPLGYLFLMAVLWQTQARLFTSKEGICYKTIGYTVFAPWDQVAGKGSRQEQRMGRGAERFRLITGLELRNPAPVFEQHPCLPSSLPPFSDPSVFIPLSPVVPDWEWGALRKELRRYAPQSLRREL